MPNGIFVCRCRQTRRALKIYFMALVISKKIIPAIVEDAHTTGLITAESSSTVAMYQISRYWRELFQTATRFESDSLPGWNEKEVAAGKVITSALLFLAMEKCRDVEQLITDIVTSTQEKPTEPQK